MHARARVGDAHHAGQDGSIAQPLDGNHPQRVHDEVCVLKDRVRDGAPHPLTT